MDKILVTLLFVVIGVAGVVGLLEWTKGHKQTAMNSSENSISTVVDGS